MTELLCWVAVLTVAVVLVALPTGSGRAGRGRGPRAQRLHAFWVGYRELHERQGLRQRPWEEDLLHWSCNGERWELHGHLSPPRGRRRSTTSTGWCPGAGDGRGRGRTA